MACPAIITGDDFLLRLLSHIDCQAQIIGSYGYQSLGQPGSLAATTATGMLTLFIALFGIRMLFGPAPGARDSVLGILKIGLVLALAFSWPAFRTLVHDVTLDGPAEIAARIAGPSIPAVGDNLAERLQAADNAMARLAEVGTGRSTGALIDRTAPGGSFEGSANDEEARFAQARFAFLGGIIGTLALLRVAAGLLLALAPLMALLLFFTATQGLFTGWLRGLVLVLLGSLGVTLMLGVELAVVEPWLADALRLRALGYATPSAPVELTAITAGFAIAQFGLIWLLSRVAFSRGWLTLPPIERRESADLWPAQQAAAVNSDATNQAARARQISGSVENLVRREESAELRRTELRNNVVDEHVVAVHGTGQAVNAGPQRLGDSWRRSAAQRGSQAARNRDARS